MARRWIAPVRDRPQLRGRRRLRRRLVRRPARLDPGRHDAPSCVRRSCSAGRRVVGSRARLRAVARHALCGHGRHRPAAGRCRDVRRAVHRDSPSRPGDAHRVLRRGSARRWSPDAINPGRVLDPMQRCRRRSAAPEDRPSRCRDDDRQVAGRRGRSHRARRSARRRTSSGPSTGTAGSGSCRRGRSRCLRRTSTGRRQPGDRTPAGRGDPAGRTPTSTRTSRSRSRRCSTRSPARATTTTSATSAAPSASRAAACAAMEPPLRQIIGVHGARMYYNLTNIHAVLRAAPFGELLAAAFNQFVGAEETARRHRDGPSRDWRESRARTGAASSPVIAAEDAWQYLFLTRRVEHVRSAPPTRSRRGPSATLLATRAPRRCCDDFRGVLDIRCHRWKNASLADAAAMVCYGALQRLLAARLPGRRPGRAPQHAAEGAARPRRAAGRRSKLWELSRMVRADAELRDALRDSGSADASRSRTIRDDRRSPRSRAPSTRTSTTGASAARPS